MAEHSSLGLSRLVSLARFIFDNPGVSVNAVASHFGRTVRQVRKDVSVLIEAGFDDLLPGRTIELDLEGYLRDGTLSLRSPLGLDRGVVITSDDLSLLVYGLHAIAHSLTKEEQELVPVALAKAASLAGTQGESVFPFIETIADPNTQQRLEQLRDAIQTPSLVTFDYVSGTGHESERRVQPLSLNFVRDCWILEGISLESGAVRSFRLDRMGHVKILGDSNGAATESSSRAEPAERSPDLIQVNLDPQAEWVTLEIPASSVDSSKDRIRAEFVVWDRAWLRTELLLLAQYVLSTEPEDVLTQAGDYASKAVSNWEAILGRVNPAAERDQNE